MREVRGDQRGTHEHGRWLRGACTVVPWVVATGAALLMTSELTPPPQDSAVTPPPASSQPQRHEKDEIVYEPWETVWT